MFWSNRKVLVTGGAGFIGSHLVEKLVKLDVKVTVLDNLQNGTLENLQGVSKEAHFIKGDCRDVSTAEKACRGQEVVMNLAARTGGVGYNNTHPGLMLSDNLIIEATMIQAAQKTGVKRFLAVSSAVVYPENATIPTPEEEGFLGEPEQANKGYGWAKRMGELLGKYYQEEFDIQVAIVRPYNCYGPRDHFFPTPTHVVPSLIRRVVDGEDPIVVWGTGKQTRAFLYVEDLTEGIVLATEKYAVSDPVNLGTDEEVSMKELVKKIILLSRRKNARVIFDTSKPDGSPRRNSNNNKAKEKLGFSARVTLEEGLRNTIAWYKAYGKAK